MSTPSSSSASVSPPSSSPPTAKAPSAARKAAGGGAALLLGGASSMMAACCTHPLDTLKVCLQTNTAALKLSGARPPGMLATAALVVRQQGITGLYKGLSAALMRQATYSTTRFAAYDYLKARLDGGGARALSIGEKFATAMLAGAAGGLAGNPMDVANVRMQADGRLPAEQRRGYKHVFDALARMTREEGFGSLYKGLAPNVQRAMLMTAGQLASYDEIKQQLLARSGGLFADGPSTHFVASTLAGGIATLITQPVDVVKTRIMMAGPGRYRGSFHCMAETVRGEGALALFKGTAPSFARLGPHTVLTFIFLEQLRALYAARS